MRKRWMVCLALLIGCLALGGCYGPFNMTQQLHDWNGDLGNKWVNELVFFFITPAYAFTTMADGLVLNSIEFWGGTNPISAPPCDCMEGGATEEGG